MTWTPIADSGIDFTFTPQSVAGTLALVGSTVQAVAALANASTDEPLFTIDSPTPVPIRFTFQSYGTTDVFLSGSTYIQAEFDSSVDGVIAENQAAPFPSPTWSLPTGPQTQWSPSAFEYAWAAGQLQYWQGAMNVESEPVNVAESFSLLIEVDVDPPVHLPQCDEVGRATRAYVSGYTRERVHQSRLFSQEKRCLIANFNGTIPKSRSIVQAQWDIDAPYAVVMSDPFIASTGQFAGRESGITLQACWEGDQVLRCQVTLDNGEIYTQLFYVKVLWRGWFGDVMPTAGPARLVVSAP